jgi:hypothetical protein
LLGRKGHLESIACGTPESKNAIRRLERFAQRTKVPHMQP